MRHFSTSHSNIAALNCFWIWQKNVRIIINPRRALDGLSRETRGKRKCLPFTEKSNVLFTRWFVPTKTQDVRRSNTLNKSNKTLTLKRRWNDMEPQRKLERHWLVWRAQQLFSINVRLQTKKTIFQIQFLDVAKQSRSTHFAIVRSFQFSYYGRLFFASALVRVRANTLNPFS